MGAAAATELQAGFSRLGRACDRPNRAIAIDRTLYRVLAAFF
jgi:hypothetical protein